MSDLSVHRIVNVTGEGITAAMQDRRLSYRARGLLALVVVSPAHSPHREWLVAMSDGDGWAEVKAALAELNEHGYRRVSKTRLPDDSWQHTVVWTVEP